MDELILESEKLCEYYQVLTFTYLYVPKVGWVANFCVAQPDGRPDMNFPTWNGVSKDAKEALERGLKAVQKGVIEWGLTPVH